MKLIIDTEQQTLVCETSEEEREYPLYSREAFEQISHQWLKVGWNQKYTYCFTWMGRPIIQLPEDMLRIQEVIYHLRPDVILETGIAHGGSLVFYASLCRVLGKGRVIGVDIAIRPHNRIALEKHDLYPLITLIEGDSTDAAVVRRVKSLVAPGETALVVLDSCHTRQHVLAELEAYHELVPPGYYLIACDGLMRSLSDVPRGKPEWIWDNPAAAAAEFVRRHPQFVLETPMWPFCENDLRENVTHWPDAWIKRRQ